jgi:hypothetical protein
MHRRLKVKGKFITTDELEDLFPPDEGWDKEVGPEDIIGATGATSGFILS